MRAAPQKRVRSESFRGQPLRGQGTPGGAPGQAWRRGARLGRAFVVLVAPLLLMLGSVYAHTKAAELKGEAARLEDEKARAEDEGEQLEVRITELSEPGRIRALAKENLGMRDPGKDLTAYESDGEDVADEGGEKNKGTGG